MTENERRAMIKMTNRRESERALIRQYVNSGNKAKLLLMINGGTDFLPSTKNIAKHSLENMI